MSQPVKWALLGLAVALLAACTPQNGLIPIDDNGNGNENTDALWETYSEGEIIYTGEKGEVGEVEFVDEDGTLMKLPAYPGYVFFCIKEGVETKQVWEKVISAGGKVVAQLPESGLFLASTQIGKENSLTSALRQFSGCYDALPLIEIGGDIVYYVDDDYSFDGSHAKTVGHQFDPGMDVQLQTAVSYGYQDLQTTCWGLASALRDDSCEMVNVSQGPKYGGNGKGKYGDNPEKSVAYVVNMIKWYNMAGDVINRITTSDAPVVLSAGNAFMHQFQFIINGLSKETKDLLNSRLFIVCAEQEHSAGPYSNSISGERIPGVVTVNIDGAVDHEGKPTAGCSIAAPTFVKYIWQLVQASQGSDNPLSFQEAATLISDRWRNSSESSITKKFIENIIAEYRPIYVKFTGSGTEEYVYEYWNKEEGTYKKSITYSERSGASASIMRYGSRNHSIFIYAFPLLLFEWGNGEKDPELSSNDTLTGFQITTYTDDRISFSIDYYTYNDNHSVVDITGLDGENPQIIVDTKSVSISEDSEWKFVHTRTYHYVLNGHREDRKYAPAESASLPFDIKRSYQLEQNRSAEMKVKAGRVVVVD